VHRDREQRDVRRALLHPPPDEQVFISWFEGGEVFRSGCCWKRGAGKIFYFSPGHETYPIYHDAKVQLVLRNACNWASATGAGRRLLPRPIEQAKEQLAPKSGENGRTVKPLRAAHSCFARRSKPRPCLVGNHPKKYLNPARHL